jgi:hypothetical protein
MSSTPISVEALTRLLRENVTKRHLVSGLGILASVGAGVYLTRKRVNQMEAEKEHRAQQDALEVSMPCLSTFYFIFSHRFAH